MHTWELSYYALNEKRRSFSHPRTIWPEITDWDAFCEVGVFLLFKSCSKVIHSVNFEPSSPRGQYYALCKLHTDQPSLIMQQDPSWFLPATDMCDFIVFLCCFTPWAIHHFQCQISVVVVKGVCVCACHAHLSDKGSAHAYSILWAGEIWQINPMWHKIIMALAKQRWKCGKILHSPHLESISLHLCGKHTHRSLSFSPLF